MTRFIQVGVLLIIFSASGRKVHDSRVRIRKKQKILTCHAICTFHSNSRSDSKTLRPAPEPDPSELLEARAFYNIDFTSFKEKLANDFGYDLLSP